MTAPEVPEVPEVPAGPGFDAEIAHMLYGWSGIGHYGPPIDGSPWAHKASVRYDTEEEARASYERIYVAKTPEENRGKATPSEMGFGLCYWKDDWGPLAVPEWSTDQYDAMNLLEEWHGDWKIRRHNGMYKVTMYALAAQGSAWAETLPLAICRIRLKAASWRPTEQG